MEVITFNKITIKIGSAVWYGHNNCRMIKQKRKKESANKTFSEKNWCLRSLIQKRVGWNTTEKSWNNLLEGFHDQVICDHLCLIFKSYFMLRVGHCQNFMWSMAFMNCQKMHVHLQGQLLLLLSVINEYWIPSRVYLELNFTIDFYYS